jgi:periplasmic protein CpxP/Spy
MRIPKTFLAASAVALGLVGHPALSQTFDDNQTRQSGRPSADASETHGWARLADRLNLSEGQRQSFRAIEEKYWPELRDLQRVLSDNRKALAELDAKDARLRELAEAQGKTIADMIVARSQLRSEMKKALTAEQLQKLNMMLEQRHHNHPRQGFSQG